MLINEILKDKQITRYRLAKISGISYSTICDICSGKTSIDKCNITTICRISMALGVSIDEIVTSYMENRVSFDVFRSNVCHRLKEVGDIGFIKEVLSEDKIRRYFRKKWYLESLYLLAMLDHLSRINNVPLCKDYDDIREVKLKEKIYPSSIIALIESGKDKEYEDDIIKNAIPEFLRFNIVESEIRDVA